MILVAGGTGFVGGGIVRELRRRGHGVAVLTRDSKRAASRFGDLGVELREGDVRDPTSLGPTLRGIPSKKSTRKARRTSSPPPKLQAPSDTYT